MNHVALIGRLTKEPELRFTQNGSPHCTFTLAVDRISGKDTEKTADFINCQVWGSQAENFCKYMDKGRQVAIEGRIQVDSMERNGERSWYTKVVCQRIEYLGSAKDSGTSQGTTAKSSSGREIGEQVSFSDEDLPF